MIATNPQPPQIFIIIGQGLAGTLLAYQLLQKGQNVQIFDAPSLPSSSKVAAGMYNPVTGKRLAKTWLADGIFPYLHQFYTQLETQLSARFFYPQSIYRPFKTIEEQNYFTAKTANFGLETYISTEANHALYSKTIHNPLGGLETHQAGWVDVPVLLEAFRQYFDKKGILISQIFGYKNIETAPAGTTIICCEGVHAKQNPYFQWLPLEPVKGELLTIHVPEASLHQIVNQGVFIVPLEEQLFKVGSTYDWDNLTWDITEEGRILLSKKLDKLLKIPYQITNQQAGLRPATTDRRPLLGLHPTLTHLGIFNGLGTKGVSLAPYFSNHFAEFLVNKKELMPDVNILRFQSLYLGKIS